VPEYDKSALRFTDYEAGVDAAVQRARKPDHGTSTEHERNPATGVWALVEKML
jgi:hypothetical protein